MQTSRIKVSIIIISCLIHLFILILLLIIYKTPSASAHSIFEFDPRNQSQEVFFQPPKEEQETWAALNPRASSLAGSIDDDMDAQGIGNNIEYDKTASQNNDDHEGSDESAQDESENTHSQGISLSYGDFNLSNAVQTSASEQSAEKSDKKLKKMKKKQAMQKMAGITRGYLEQIKEEGNNLIKTMGGDPNKTPTERQLKYERYMSKLQWCLQNAHNINREKCRTDKAIETTMRVSLTIQRDGRLSDVKIIQASGHAIVDHYIDSLFHYASSSFPPVPAYIKEDPFTVLYTVFVQWNVAQPFAMGFARE